MDWSDPRQRGSFKFLCTCRSVISSFANGVKGLYSIQCQDLIGFVSSIGIMKKCAHSVAYKLQGENIILTYEIII